MYLIKYIFKFTRFTFPSAALLSKETNELSHIYMNNTFTAHMLLDTMMWWIPAVRKRHQDIPYIFSYLFFFWIHLNWDQRFLLVFRLYLNEKKKPNISHKMKATWCCYTYIFTQFFRWKVFSHPWMLLKSHMTTKTFCVLFFLIFSVKIVCEINLNR